ncbi:hypothetical protein D0865_14675 [Hortaea werneckii]|uniref:Uncharacterized protein n=1 Tax=Hortaea werneckii TaxID=91943 RepID=A0A3M7AYS7_HORWE|nr:hypothetical protein D0865_14675 [Hortaea werneckii]
MHLTAQPSHKRREKYKSATKADLIASMLKSAPTLSDDTTAAPLDSFKSPRDSLSPIDDCFEEASRRKGSEFPRDTSTFTCSSKCSGAWLPLDFTRSGKQQLIQKAGTQSQSQKAPHDAFLDVDANHAIATQAVSTPAHAACSPRSPLITRPHRPTDLKIDRSNGLTAIPTNDLRSLIRDGHTAGYETSTQVPRPKPKKPLSKSHSVTMGSNSSTLNGQSEADDASLNSGVRRPMRVLRKSSTNLFKRVDSKSPLPRPLTATSIIVTDRKPSDLPESPVDPYLEPAHKAREPIILHSDSTMTVDEKAADDISAAAKPSDDSDKENQSPRAKLKDNSEHNEDNHGTASALRASALSPTIPAPSPLPEDSPHKYGLKDRMETPEPEPVKQPPPPEPVELNKAQRRSSGLEIFNEAKSLQSAQSFLNGLSTSRRRAESMNRMTDSTWPTTTTTSRPVSRPGSRPTSTRPPSALHMNTATGSSAGGGGYNDIDGRKRGHNFKTNGFAYSRALNLTQLQCYRSHTRLLRSKNKAAPVECAVCHMDDDQEHWTCSWCALRMCRYCRKAFGEGGVKALRGRIREAEIGGCDGGLDGEGSDSEGEKKTGRRV